MTIDSHHEQQLLDRRTRKCDGRRCSRLLVVQHGLDWSPGRVQWLGRSYKGVSPRNRDRPSQMKHAELKNRPFLFRVSF